MQPSTYVCSPPPLCTTYAEMQFLYGRTCSQYSTVHSNDTAVNGVSVTVLLNLHPRFTVFEFDSYSVVSQPGGTSAELRIPILDDSLGWRELRTSQLSCHCCSRMCQ